MGTCARRLRAGLGALLAACLLATGLPITTAHAVDETRGYDGYCQPADSNGVTVVIDFQDLDGNDGRDASTIIRCAPVANNDASIRRTGLQVLVDAGIEVYGTDRWGHMPDASFVCRLEGRPALAEPLHLTATDTTYFEQCRNTPPGDAYWSYWHSDGAGQDWTYSDLGVMARTATPGGFEGWSFSHNANFTGDDNDNPKPRIAPTNPTQSVTLTTNRSTVKVGQSFTLTWDAAGAEYVTASGSWNGRRLSTGSETLTAVLPGQQTYTLTTYPSNLTKTVTVTATGTTVINPDPDTNTVPNSALAMSTAEWLIAEMSPQGHMPGPYSGTDWGLTIDTLWALYAAGTGKSAAAQITTEVEAHAGEYLGPDLFADKDARIAGSTAKLLVAAVVAGKDPTAFGYGDYVARGKRYDLRAETLSLIGADGMIRNRGTGNDDTNIFAQSLAVIGLARSGGVPRSQRNAVTFLASQQCSAGYFRMFYADGLSCDAGKGSADTDGTAMAVQALIAARSAGVSDLDSAIDKALDWLLKTQHGDGSFGGGVSTQAPNSNSTGLAAQAMTAGMTGTNATRAKKLSSAVTSARSWVQTITASVATAAATKLINDFGAIAYNPSTFSTAKVSGISTANRDQWRRASAQAILALAPVSFLTLGTTTLNESTNPRPSPRGDTEKAPTITTTATPAAVPRTTTAAVVKQAAQTTQATPNSPSAALESYLTSTLVNGTHVEVTVDNTTYADYDLTADVAIALWNIGASRAVRAKVAAFLLSSKAIAAYAHGAEYENGPAAYAEPLAKLSLIARLAKADGLAPQKVDQTIASLGSDVSALRGTDGRFTDTGTYADHSGSTTRQAWATLAATMTWGDNRTGTEQDLLLGAQCADGLFAVTVDTTSCETGDAAATALAVAALNTDTAVSATAENGTDARIAAANEVPVSWTEQRRAALEKATTALVSSTDRTGLSRTNRTDVATAGALAAGKSAVGLDGSAAISSLASFQGASGGLPVTGVAKSAASSSTTRSGTTGEGTATSPAPPTDVAASIAAAPALIGHSWLALPSSPLRTVVAFPLAAHSATDQPTTIPAPASDPVPWWWVATMIVALAMGAGSIVVTLRTRPRSTHT